MPGRRTAIANLTAVAGGYSTIAAAIALTRTRSTSRSDGDTATRARSSEAGLGDAVGGAEGPAELALRLWQAFRGRMWETVASMLHPEAELASSLTPGQLLGPQAMVELWRAAVEEGRFDPKPAGFVELDGGRALLLGAFKPGRETGQADALVLTFRDGLLWRSQYYESAEEAQQAAARE